MARPVDHGPHATPESGEGNHRNVDDEEEHQESGDEEMQRARGLAPSEELTAAGTAESKAGDSARPVQMTRGNRTKINDEICGALNDVVEGFRLPSGGARRRYFAITARNAPPIPVGGRGEQVVAEVASSRLATT